MSGSGENSRRNLDWLTAGYLVYAFSLVCSYAYPGRATPLDNLLLSAITPLAFMILTALFGPMVVYRMKYSYLERRPTLIRIWYLYPFVYRSFAAFARTRRLTIVGSFLLASGLCNLLFNCHWR